MKANRFLLDTAYVLALLNPKDTYHKHAKTMLPSMYSSHEVWLTEAVLIEIANALASSNRSAAIAFINSCYITPNVRVVSVDSRQVSRHCYCNERIPTLFAVSISSSSSETP